jgi:hypothetical protein
MLFDWRVILEKKRRPYNYTTHVIANRKSGPGSRPGSAGRTSTVYRNTVEYIDTGDCEPNTSVEDYYTTTKGTTWFGQLCGRFCRQYSRQYSVSRPRAQDQYVLGCTAL